MVVPISVEYIISDGLTKLEGCKYYTLVVKSQMFTVCLINPSVPSFLA